MSDPEEKAPFSPRDLVHNTIPQRFSDAVRSAVTFVPQRLRKPSIISDAPKNAKKKGKRNRHKNTKVAFFRYCYYEPAFRFFVEQVLDAEYLPLPDPTRRTTELGSQHATDYVCTPFKHMMGDYLEALELGADVLVSFCGFCRLSYYGELHELILRDLGYDFRMLNFAEGLEEGYLGYAKECIKVVNPDVDIPHGVRQLLATKTMVNRLDEAYDYYLAHAGFEDEPGSFRRAWESYMSALEACTGVKDINETFSRAMKTMRELPTHKPAKPLRIGIVGEMFTAIDPHSNLGLDEKMLAMGVEVHRMLNLSNRMLSYNEDNMRLGVSEYATYEDGPTSTITLAAAKKYAQAGFDGIIHAKSAGCTPEIDCVPMLQRISRDFGIPILYLTYDAQTSDTGLDTRLEAFYDMLAMKKEIAR